MRRFRSLCSGLIRRRSPCPACLQNLRGPRVELALAVTVMVLLGGAAAGAAYALASHATRSGRVRAATPLTVDMCRGVGAAPPGGSPTVVGSRTDRQLLRAPHAVRNQARSRRHHGVRPCAYEAVAGEVLTISKNRLVYTFKLHPGMKFPSGKPVGSPRVQVHVQASASNECERCRLRVRQPLPPPQIKTMATPDSLTFV